MTYSDEVVFVPIDIGQDLDDFQWGNTKYNPVCREAAWVSYSGLRCCLKPGAAIESQRQSIKLFNQTTKAPEELWGRMPEPKNGLKLTGIIIVECFDSNLIPPIVWEWDEGNEREIISIIIFLFLEEDPEDQ